MIPQIAEKLLDKFSQKGETLFDPYCGTGTTLVEGMIHGLNVIGTDINPLAHLIATAKTTPVELKELDSYLRTFEKATLNFSDIELPENLKMQGIRELGFWFKPDVIKKLFFLKDFINRIEVEEIKTFFKIAFSETVRESSNTRNGEFKLFRYEKEKLEAFAPDVFGIMMKKIIRNRKGLEQFNKTLDKLEKKPKVAIYDFNSVFEIPTSAIKPETVDIVITSPPYGDSRTTVAYGQYSHLSSAWLDLPDPEKVDRNLMGGKPNGNKEKFPSESLNRAIAEIKAVDEKRVKDVVAFYCELLASIKNVAKVIKKNGHACYVVANRKVKGIILPTDIAIQDFFTDCGFSHLETFTRTIPNKRMPSKNSPTNEPGKTDATMTNEFVVVMRKTRAVAEEIERNVGVK
jgi:DNA modification methylase